MADEDAGPPPIDAAEVAARLGAGLEQGGHEYALGGAIALGYWGEPRATVDVDVTIFLPPSEASSCIRVLQEVGCDVDAKAALESFDEDGFCEARYRGVRVHVFLPIVPFYETARRRRARVRLAGRSITIWDREALAVFKMMFFRRKDVADVEQILRIQGESLDRSWVRERLAEMYGERDPRLSQWDELCDEVTPPGE